MTSSDRLFDFQVGLGTWQWGDKFIWGYGNGYQKQDLTQVFQGALDHNCEFFDTAEVYGNGSSEKFLGELMTQTDRRPFIATKFFPFPWRFTEKAFVNALKQSLQRLRLEKVDLYQIHWPNPIVPFDIYAKGFKAAKEEGLIDLIGVSNFDQNKMLSAVSALDRYGLSLASNQVEYSLLNRSIEKDGLLNRCHELNIRVIAYSPLGMGFLSGKYSGKNMPNSYRNARYASRVSKIQPLIALMTEIGHYHSGRSTAQVAINWCKQKNTLPIPGAKNAIQAESNADAVSWDLTAEEVTMLDQASEKLQP